MADTTGEYSIYTIYEGHEIMFHVSTLLPYVKDSKQQLERKRHIGNDIVTIVFQDLDDNLEPDFTPSSARSQFQHIFALVTYNRKENSYRLRIYSEQSVPPFGPSLPTPPVFTNHKEFREFLLVKLINGEKSAFNNSVFGKRRKRTIEAIINSLHSNYDKENFKMNSNLIGEVISDALISGNIRTRKKEELRKAEFLRIGQSLKLQTIIKGDAPTSQITTAAAKKELLEPKLFLESFENTIICSDSWNDLLVVGTNNGIFVIDEAIPWETKELFDKTVSAKQLDICESYGLLILLVDKGRLCIFMLSELQQILNDSSSSSSNLDQSTTLIKNKTHCKERKLDFINGCHVYAVSKQMVSKSSSASSSSPSDMRIAAACGKKIFLINMKNSNQQSSSSSLICQNCQPTPSSSSNTTTNANSSSIAATLIQTNGSLMAGIANLAIGSNSCPSPSNNNSTAAAANAAAVATTTTNLNAIASILSSNNSNQQQQQLHNTAIPLSSSFQNGLLTNDDSNHNTKMMTMMLPSELTSLFQIRKEIQCSEMPHLLNLVDSMSSSDSYLLIGYKSKLEIVCERTGDCLKQFQFNSLSTIRSIVELYDDKDRVEALVTYNYTSEFIRLDELNNSPSSATSTSIQQQQQQSSSVNKSSYYSFQWNSEPSFILCIFPYVIGFASQCIEIRLLVNGNLVNSITMSNIKIVASKREIYFAADHELLSKEMMMTTNVVNNYITLTAPSILFQSQQQQQQQQDENNQSSSSPPNSPGIIDKDFSSSSTSASNKFPTTTILNSNSSSSSSTTQPTKPCSIYKINLDFLRQSSHKAADKFVFNQLCENSTRTIQREISNYSSQFMFYNNESSDNDATTNKHNSIYRKIISSNKNNNEESTTSNSSTPTPTSASSSANNNNSSSKMSVKEPTTTTTLTTSTSSSSASSSASPPFILTPPPAAAAAASSSTTK